MKRRTFIRRIAHLESEIREAVLGSDRHHSRAELRVAERSGVWVTRTTQLSIALLPTLFAAVLFGPLAVAGRLLGYRGSYSRYASRNVAEP